MSISVPPLPQSSGINESGHLEVGGCDVVSLADEFGTPLYVYDENHLRERCREYVRSFSSNTENFEIVYASKAFTCIAMCQLVAQEGLSLDVASGGELHIAIKSGFPLRRIYLHGNANSRSELRQALEAGVGHVVVDSLDELRTLDELAGELGLKQPILLRITPGIEAHTHEFIQTGKLDSKFGLCLADGVAAAAVTAAMSAANLELLGVHAHIGSQIFTVEPYQKTVSVLAEFLSDCKREHSFECSILNLGGGLGAVYTAGDDPPGIDALGAAVFKCVSEEMQQRNLPVPRIVVEPGRSITANAGLTAYRVQAVKTVPGIRTFVAVDGGMSDNLRPVLYGARYDAIIAGRPDAEADTTVTVAGKHCESGDILVRDIDLPKPAAGDILVTPSTGAYGYSMASNYNGQPRPAVLFVNGGKARVIIRRESHEDLVHLHQQLE
ncbi:MAG: diaminopimelate decarboxylase [Actinomycetota bacterium]